MTAPIRGLRRFGQISAASWTAPRRRLPIWPTACRLPQPISSSWMKPSGPVSRLAHYPCCRGQEGLAVASATAAQHGSRISWVEVASGADNNSPAGLAAGWTIADCRPIQAAAGRTRLIRPCRLPQPRCPRLTQHLPARPGQRFRHPTGTRPCNRPCRATLPCPDRIILTCPG